ncbi:hypothetical protein PR048_018485 [Dryococelus australis]|uniref:Uncharacterized protein n=1 Tax=Dryococelus australis TaxID=614101 RepID=A0ABQ9HCE6_9NEOP|nr:hypothetical protein PR048_018485 [Dryococelus australis]
MQLTLAWAGNQLQQAAILAEKALTDPAQYHLFRATCWDLAHIRNGFEEEHVLIICSLNSGRHVGCHQGLTIKHLQQARRILLGFRYQPSSYQVLVGKSNHDKHLLISMRPWLQVPKY